MGFIVEEEPQENSFVVEETSPSNAFLVEDTVAPIETNTQETDIDIIIKSASAKHSVDSDLVKAIIKAESNFNPKAISPKGAMGLMQLMPNTAKDLGVKDAYNPQENIEAGTRHFKKLLDRYNGDTTKALAAYNWGIGNLDKQSLSKMPEETKKYIDNVNKYFNQTFEVEHPKLEQPNIEQSQEPDYGALYEEQQRKADPNFEQKSQAFINKNFPTDESAIKPEEKFIIEDSNANFVVEQDFEIEEPNTKSDFKWEKPKTFFEKATEPLKRIPEIYQKEVAESTEQFKQKGFLNKAFGGLRYIFSPLTAPVEALVGEPTYAQSKRFGASPNEATFVRNLAEGAAYMWSPSKAITSNMAKAPTIFKQLSKIEKAKSAKRGFQAMKFIKNRRANIDKAVLESQEFIVKNIERPLSKIERKALPFVRQGVKDIKVLEQAGLKDIAKIVANPSKKVLVASKKMGKYYDESYEFLKKHGSEPEYIENYVTQLWDIPKNRKNSVMNYFRTHNPFTQKRKIPTLEEGLKLGLTPKTTDAAELLKIYDGIRINVAFNLKFADEIKGMVDDVGQKMVMPTGKAPSGWVKISHPALKRSVYKGKIGKEGVLVGDSTVSVHPDIATEVKNIFGGRFNHKVISGLETINAVAKKAMLTGSFFHHLALGESALSSGVGKKAIGLWNPKKIYKALKNKDFEIYKKMPLAKDSIDHGLSFGALSDVQLSKVNNLFKAVERGTKNIPVVGKGVKLARKTNDLWDRALWDYYHNTLKLTAYESQVAKELKRLNPKNQKEISKIKNQVAGFVNDSFGGQNFEISKVLGNPKMQQMMQWVLLAPDWTVSTLKQAAAPITGLVKGNKSQMVTGAKFWARAAMYNVIIGQTANYSTTKKITGKGKFTWENDPGHETHIFAGYNDDGTKKYLRTGKQFREAIEWAIDPLKKFGGKLSPVMRETIRQFSGSDPGSMFPTEFKDEGFWDSLPKRAISIAKLPVPFSLRPYLKKGSPKTFMFTLPASKGMTNYKTVKLFKNAIKKKDSAKIKRVYISALENNLEAMSLFKISRSSLKSEMTMDDKIIANDIISEMRGLNPQEKKDLLKVYKQRGILTKNVWKQFNRLIKRQESIKAQKKAFKIEEK